MSNILTPSTTSQKRVNTKRDLLIELYQRIQIEINEIIDVSFLFPKTDEQLDIADVIFHISFLLPPGCDVKAIVRVLLRDAAIIKNISYTEDQLESIIPIVEKFLKIYYTI